MKLTQVYYYQGLFKGLEREWPVKPVKPVWFKYEYESRRQEYSNLLRKYYTEFLPAALKDSFDFEDQQQIKVWACALLNPNVAAKDWTPLEGVYSIPEIKVEVINFCPACNAVQMRNCAHFDACGNTKSVFRIKPSPMNTNEQSPSLKPMTLDEEIAREWKDYEARVTKIMNDQKTMLADQQAEIDRLKEALTVTLLSNL